MQPPSGTRITGRYWSAAGIVRVTVYDDTFNEKWWNNLDPDQKKLVVDDLCRTAPEGSCKDKEGRAVPFPYAGKIVSYHVHGRSSPPGPVDFSPPGGGIPGTSGFGGL